jgi:hypothetical protein
VCYSSREFGVLYKEIPFFMHAFFYHYLQPDLDLAEKLYKEAIRRAEFTKGCYNMLVSIYLQKSNFGANINLFTTKMEQMEQEHGHFFQYDSKIYD